MTFTCLVFKRLLSEVQLLLRIIVLVVITVTKASLISK